MSTKDAEVRGIVAELDSLLDDLRSNVDALTAILGSRDGEEEGAPA
jgi:hypothetical protein